MRPAFAALASRLDAPEPRRYGRAARESLRFGADSSIAVRVSAFVLSKIFTWWSGATIGALWTIHKRGRFVGEDAMGNRYFEAKDARDSYDGRKLSLIHI